MRRLFVVSLTAVPCSIVAGAGVAGSVRAAVLIAAGCWLLAAGAWRLVDVLDEAAQ